MMREFISNHQQNLVLMAGNKSNEELRAQRACRIQTFDDVKRIVQRGLVFFGRRHVVGVTGFVQLARDLRHVLDLIGQSFLLVGGQRSRFGGQSFHDVTHFERSFVNGFKVLRLDDFVERGIGRVNFLPYRCRVFEIIGAGR